MFIYLRFLGQRTLLTKASYCLTHLVHCIVKHTKPLISYSAFQKRFPRSGWAWYAGLLISLGLQKQDKNEYNSEQFIIDNIKAAILAHQEGHSNKAEQLLHLALKVAQEQQHTEAVTYIYDIMANIALDRAELEKSERLFKSVVQHLIKSGMDMDDNAVLEISIKLAGTYERLGKLAEAESGYDYCLQHLRKKVKTDMSPTEDTVLLWAMCADAYGRYLSSQKNYLEASGYFSEALDACMQILGASHPQTLVIMNNLGSSYMMAGNYEDAVKHLKAAVEVARSTGSEDFATYCYNLGMVYLEMAKTTEAVFYCKWAASSSPIEGDTHKKATECLKQTQK